MKRSSPENIRSKTPLSLRRFPQWVCWRIEDGEPKPRKVPVCPGKSFRASSTNPSHWRAFNKAMSAFKTDSSLCGIGFVFTASDPFCGVDLDNCRDPESGKIMDWAQDIVDALSSYTEISPSGTGLKIFIKAAKPGKKCKSDFASGEVEIYDHSRYFTVTGNHLSGTSGTVEERQAELIALYEKVFGTPVSEDEGNTQQPAKRDAPAVQLTDDEIIRLATTTGQNGEKFAALWDGHWNDYYNSCSNADSSLVFKLAFYTKDAVQIDRIFRRSGLYRDKWDEMRGDQTYGELTISKALAKVSDQYQPSRREGKPPKPKTEELDAIIKQGDVGHLFDNAQVFARLDKAEFGKIKAQLKDKFGRNLNLIDFSTAVREARRGLCRERLRGKSVLPSIMTVGRQLRDVVDEGIKALIAANEPPILFCRSGAVAVLSREEKLGHNTASVKSLSGTDTPTMKDHLSRAADFYRTGSSGEDVPCNPPYDVASVILSRNDLPFPLLDGVTQSPVMRSDGSILTAPGYDPASRLYYVPDGRLKLPEIPEYPKPSELSDSVELLREMVCDFPFTEEACRANLFALLLGIVMRPLIDGCVPLALIDAPRQGTGKGLLAAIVSLVTTGGEPAIMTAPRSANDDEWRKRITSTLMGGPSVVLLDNVDEPLESASLAAMLTAREWEDRRLGVSENVRLPVRAVWFGTGNNLQIRGDMPRRCYQVRIDSNLAQPWRRDGFRHPNQQEWVRKNRGALLAALLTIARSWCVAGRPTWSATPLGSFENWCRVVGGALEHAGITGFLANTDRLYEESDEDTSQWLAFFNAWRNTFGCSPVKVKDLCSEILNRECFSSQTALRRTLPDDLVTAVDKGTGNLSRRLGIALRTRRDTIHGENRLVCAGKDSHDKVLTWKLEPVSQNSCKTPNPAESAADFAGSAGFEKANPAPNPATVSPLENGSNKNFAESAESVSIPSAYARGVSEKTQDNKYIYKERSDLNPANPADGSQPQVNADSYDCGFACGFQNPNPAYPANAENRQSPPADALEKQTPSASDNGTANEPPGNSDEPSSERWVI